MFEDIIDKKVITGGFHWDIDKYIKNPYCPTCGSESVVTIRDHLTGDQLINDKKCKDCGVEWKEIYNKSVDLESLQGVIYETPKGRFI